MELSARFLAFTTYGVQWVLWLLIGLSVISITVMLERLWHFATYRPDSQSLAAEIRQLSHHGPARRAAAPDGARAEALDAACEGAKARERLRLERNLAFLGTLGSNAPFIGLFGTVLGIIKAFHDLAGNQAGGPAVVMAGISEALVATAVGLMVAIPAVVGYNYFNRRIRTSMTEVDWMAHLALVEVKTQDAEAAARGSESPEGADAAAERVAPEPVGQGMSFAAWGRRLLPLGVMGALLLILGGVWIGRSTSSSSRTSKAELPIVAPAPPIYLPPSTTPSGTTAPTTPSSAAAPATALAAAAPAAAPPVAQAPTGPAPIPSEVVAAATLSAAPAVAPAMIPPAAVPSAAVVPAVTQPTAVISTPVPAATIPSAAAAAPAAKPAAHPAPALRKGTKQWKGKKGRPQGAGKPASPAPEGSAAAPAKVDESPAKAADSAPVGPGEP